MTKEEPEVGVETVKEPEAAEPVAEEPEAEAEAVETSESAFDLFAEPAVAAAEPAARAKHAAGG